MSDLTAKEFVIVSLLISRAEPTYGLQLVRASDGAIARGSVYVLLDRLEDKGFVTSAPAPRAEGESGIAKRLYSLTAKGVRACNAAPTGYGHVVPSLACG